RRNPIAIQSPTTARRTRKAQTAGRTATDLRAVTRKNRIRRSRMTARRAATAKQTATAKMLPQRKRLNRSPNPKPPRLNPLAMPQYLGTQKHKKQEKESVNERTGDCKIYL